ncbi:MAG: hypothetical protein LUH04_02485 [Clostridium sp.]|nr:hypothetical protein [Clostridium sp.]
MEHQNVRRGRYNMDFDPKKGDPYGNLEKALRHIDDLKRRERMGDDPAGEENRVG